MKVPSLLIGALALAGVGYLGWTYFKPTVGVNPVSNPSAANSPRSGAPAAGLPAAPVVAVEAATANVPVTLSAIGTVQAFSSVSLKSQIDGQIMRVHFTEGQTVRKGDLLFSLDPRPFEAALRQAEANLAKDRALLDKARADLARVQELARKDFATQSRFDEMKANVAALQATIAAGQAQVDAAKLRLEYTEIVAPIEGRAGSILINVGNLVKANDVGALVIINQTKPIHFQFSVPESHLGEIGRRMAAGKVAVRGAVPNETRPAAEGMLTFVNNTVDVATGTIQLKATYANGDERFTPGQFVNISVELANLPNAVVIPAAAVQVGQQGQFVFRVKADNTVEVQAIQTGVAFGRLVVVARGLEAGDRVVTEGQLRLRPGSRVNVRDPASPPGGRATAPNGPPG